MKVELVDSMGDDLTIANVARVSFNKWKTEFDEKDARLIDYLARHEHTSPFRHTAIQLRCEAPVFLARQLGKHQVGLTWNEVSRRYVDADIEFFVPDSWRSRPTDGMKQGSGTEEIDEYFGEDAYGWYSGSIKNDYLNALQACQTAYCTMVEHGVAPEMARMVLPQSMMVSWIWTGSLTAFYHVWRLRIDPHAQKEAQDFAKLLEQVIEPIFPHSWAALTNASTTN